MNAYVIINGINSLCALAIVLLILLRKPQHPLHFTYINWSVSLFIYTVMYFIWGIQKEADASLFWFKLIIYALCFIHASYFHFTLTFSNQTPRFRKHLFAAYLSVVVLIIINFYNGLFDASYVRPKPPLPNWPHAGPYLPLLILVECYFVLLSFKILYRASRDAVSPQNFRLATFLWAGTIGWLGGFTNWFYYYDSTPIPPVGNIFISFYAIVSAYLVLKHDMLGLNFVRHTIVYALLTLFITLIFMVIIIASERAFQSYFGYNSFLVSLSAAAVITILFNPVRGLLNTLIDKKFFGQNIQGLSEENLIMRHKLVDQDRMRAVATLAAGMAHEIKNPLTSIKTFAEYLPQKYDDPDFRNKFKKIVADEVDRVNHIVAQLLEFAKPKQADLRPGRIELVVDQTLELLNNNFISRSVDVHKDYEAGQDLIFDKNQMRQVFLNLFLNSVSAMPQGGRLIIGTRTTIRPSDGKRRATITIQDTGYGISQENLSHIFDPFFTTEGDAGTGLGLAIVYNIIREHGGEIQVTSRPQNGTLVTIYLNIHPNLPLP